MQPKFESSMRIPEEQQQAEQPDRALMLGADFQQLPVVDVDVSEELTATPSRERRTLYFACRFEYKIVPFGA